MYDPSQYNATYSTNADVSSLGLSPGRMVLLEELLALKNKLFRAGPLSTDNLNTKLRKAKNRQLQTQGSEK